MLALPFAIKAGYAVCRVIAAMLNFDILTTALPWHIYAALILAGGLLPVLAAAWPVRRWSGVAVRDALENYGAKSRTRQGTILKRLPIPLPVTTRVGVRNALRNPARFALGTVTIAIGALVFMLAMNMRSSVLNTAETEEATVLYDISISFEEDTRMDEVNWMINFPTVTRLEMWPATRATTVGASEFEQLDIPVLGIPADTWAVKPNLVEGRWLSDANPNGVVATHRMMKRLPGLTVGDLIPLQFGERVIEVELVGVEKRFGPASLRMPLSGYFAMTGATPGLGRVLFLDLNEDAGPKSAEFIPLLESHLPMTSLKVSQISTSRLAARVIRGHLDVIVVMLGFVAALILSVSALGMASGTSTSVIERTRELGVLRAIGATPATVFGILTVEAMVVALSGCLLALLLANPLSERLEYLFGSGIVEYPFDHRFSFGGLAICVALMVVLAVAATLGPARLVTRGAVRTAVNYE
jgi:putative ABC transport system permease protein